MAELEARAGQQIDDYHSERPMERGMPREELRSKLPGVSPPLFAVVLDRLTRSGSVVSDQDVVRRTSFKPKVVTGGAQLDKIKSRIGDLLEAGGLTPPRDKEISADLDLEMRQIQAALKLMVSDGSVVKVTEGLHFAASHLQELEVAVVKHLEAKETLSAQEIKALTGASRKFTIPLGEYFDRIKLTMRVGDVRVLRRKSGE